jgi:hypothetical protein
MSVPNLRAGEILVKRFMLVLVLTLISSPLFAQDAARTWEGTWNNKKFGTKGPLKCVATEDDKGVFKATFTGKFMGDPFKYEATFESKKKGRNQRTLSGKSVIRGHDYKWTGEMKGKSLKGKYTSSVGYFGTFVLKEVTKK